MPLFFSRHVVVLTAPPQARSRAIASAMKPLFAVLLSWHLGCASSVGSGVRDRVATKSSVLINRNRSSTLSDDPDLVLALEVPNIQVSRSQPGN